jgi:hypothetical protein
VKRRNASEKEVKRNRPNRKECLILLLYTVKYEYYGSIPFESQINQKKPGKDTRTAGRTEGHTTTPQDYPTKHTYKTEIITKKPTFHHKITPQTYQFRSRGVSKVLGGQGPFRKRELGAGSFPLVKVHAVRPQSAVPGFAPFPLEHAIAGLKINLARAVCIKAGVVP